jgi:hypothetical protein
LAQLANDRSRVLLRSGRRPFRGPICFVLVIGQDPRMITPVIRAVEPARKAGLVRESV